MTKMYNLLTIVAVVFFMQQGFSQQPWMKNINKTNPTLFDIKKAFTSYQENEKSSAWKDGKEGDFERYKRWEWYWEQRVNQDGTFPKASITYDEWSKYVSSHGLSLAKSAQTSGNWTAMGPDNSQGGYEGIGRISTIAFHPSDPNTIFVGTPAGGIWKSTDKGSTWTTNSDNLPVLGVSDIAINPTNANEMYIATGDGDNGSLYGNGDTKSVGILKSTNGGATWDLTGMNWTVQQQKLIRRLAMNPQDPNTVLAATSDGIYRTTDGGTNWAQVQAGTFIDIIYKPGDGTTAYASNNGYNSQIWLTGDGGASWGAVSSFTDVTRIQLAVTPINPTIVKAVCALSNRTFGGFYGSTNSGTSFSLLCDTTGPNIFGYEYDGSDKTSGQGEYDLCVAISPLDANIVTVGSVNTWMSYNGGSTWEIRTMWGGGSNPNNVQVVHADKHFHVFQASGEFWEANDGGIYYNADGSQFVDKSNGLMISQFYKLSTSQIIPSLVLGGLQDNSCKATQGGQWMMAAPTGDGMEVLCDPTDTLIYYVSGPQGKISRTNDQFNTATTDISANLPGGQKDGSWITPYVIDPNDAATLYAGYDEIYKSTDRGDSWTAISNGIAGGDLFKMIAVAHYNSQIIYAGNSSKIYYTNNGGGSWAEITPGITGAAGFFSYIAISPTDPQNVLITISGYTAGVKVLVSGDAGATWNNMSGTLPNLPATCVVIDNSTNGGVYIGTDVGVFFRGDAMSDWQAFSTGLPNVIVNELEIQKNSGKLRAATFGRGLWESDLYVPTGINTVSTNNKNDICIYPNPNNGSFTLNAPKAKAGDKASIYNFLGQLVKTIILKNSKQEIKMNDQKEGIYYLGIDSYNYQNIQKIIKVK